MDKTLKRIFDFAVVAVSASGFIVGASALANNRDGCKAEDLNIAINPAYQLLGIGTTKGECSPGYTRVTPDYDRN